MQFPLDPDVIAREIGIPLETWPGNCHGIADAILQKMPIEGMRLVRGHYHGHVHKESIFTGGGTQHSWLELKDGRILDPTFWTFTSPHKPFIYLGLNEDHDEGGLQMKARLRPQMTFGLLLSGAGSQAADFILKKLEDAEPVLMDQLLKSLDLDPGATINTHLAEQVKSFMDAPVEHIPEPALFHASLAEIGLKALVPLDSWIRVMEPERVTPPRGANFFYDPPPAEDLTDMQKLFRVFCHFLSIENRDAIETELEEYGYSLDDLHEALNRMESCLRMDPNCRWMPAQERDLLCVVASDLLGRGFGEEIRVERYAASLGLDRAGLHLVLQDFAQPAGFDLGWLHGKEAERAEARRRTEPALEIFI